MGWLMEIAIGVCLIILAGGAVNWVNGYIEVKKREQEAQVKMGKGGGGVEERLDEIERRMTDVQDVMIALSEKFDRWEQEKAHNP